MGGGARNPKNPFSCVCLHGDRKPQERKENLERFKVKIKKNILPQKNIIGVKVAGFV